MIHNDRLVHGPYKQDYREEMLRALLEATQKLLLVFPGRPYPRRTFCKYSLCIDSPSFQ